MNWTAGTMLMVMLFLNGFMFLSQAGIDALWESESNTYFSYEGSLISEYDAGNYTVRPFSSDELPAGQAPVDSSGGIFTDTFATLKNWILDIPGVRQLIAIVDAVPNFLKTLQLPAEIAYALGFIWHVLAVFLLVEWIRG